MLPCAERLVEITAVFTGLSPLLKHLFDVFVHILAQFAAHFAHQATYGFRIFCVAKAPAPAAIAASET